MKKIYDMNIFLDWGNGKPSELLTWNGYNLLIREEKPENREFCCNTFNDLLDLLDEYSIPCLEVQETLFRKKPYVQAVIGFESYRIEPKGYKPITITYKFSEVHPTMEDLAKNLSGEDFVEWLKDRGINCVSVK
jgi:hypothetical protein